MRIPHRFHNVALSALMAWAMLSMISAVLTAMITGGLNAWLPAYPIAFPTLLAAALSIGLTLMPFVRRRVDRLVAPPE